MENPIEGQMVGLSIHAFRYWERRGCGSNPKECEVSRIEPGVLGGELVFCDLKNLDKKNRWL